MTPLTVLTRHPSVIFIFLCTFLTTLCEVSAQSQCVEFLNSAPISEQTKKLEIRNQIYGLLEEKIYAVIDDIEILQMSLENSNPDISPVGYRKLVKLTNDLSHLWEIAVELLAELENLKPQLANVENNMLPFFSAIQNKITKSKIDYSFQKDYAARLIVRYSNAQSMTFDSIIENPKLAIANFGYDIQDEGGGAIKIFFSSKIVKDLFHSESTVQSRVVSRSLKDAQKGIFGANYDGAGIKRRLLDRNLVEIRSLGRDANFRLYGYVYNSNEVHIVNYTISSNHDSSQLQHRINLGIYTSRESRGHD